MTSLKLQASFAAALLALVLTPSVGWSTRIPAGVASGQITAAPGASSVEVAHRTYRVKANSPAQKALGSIAPGTKVDLVLDGPAENPDSEVVSIITHAEP